MDIEGSRIAGWMSIYYKNINTIGNEKRPKGMTTLSGSIYKGLVNTKLYNGLKLDRYYEYGYAYVGYLIYGFCKWLNELAKNKNIDKFLFVSRDMYIVYGIYNKFFGQINSEYIKASRTSSIHLSFNRQIEHFFDWHVRRRISSKMTIIKVLEELEFGFLKEELEKYDLLENEILTNENIESLKSLIYENKERILALYEKEKKAAAMYYKGAIGDAGNVCIVDLGWKSSTFSSLEYFLKEECGIKINLFSAMLGMEGHDFVDERMCDGKIFSYMFSSQHNTDLMLLHNKEGNIWRRIYEIIFTSNELSLLKFNLNEDKNICFEYLRKEVRNDMIVDNIHQGILDFVENFKYAEEELNLDLCIAARDSYKPLQQILYEKEYNYELFKDFEVCFIAGNVKKENIEMFKDVVLKGGK